MKVGQDPNANHWPRKFLKNKPDLEQFLPEGCTDPTKIRNIFRGKYITAEEKTLIENGYYILFEDGHRLYLQALVFDTHIPRFESVRLFKGRADRIRENQILGIKETI